MKKLIMEMEIDNALRVAHNRQEDIIVDLFLKLIKPTIRPFLNFVCSSYDYDDDVYISFECNNKVAKDVAEEIEKVFGWNYVAGGGDYTTEFLIGLDSLKEEFK